VSKFAKIFSLMLLSLSATAANAQLATVNLLAEASDEKDAKAGEPDFNKVFGWKKPQPQPKTLSEYVENEIKKNSAKDPFKGLTEKQIVAKVFNQQAQDKNSKLYAQLKDVVVGYGDPGFEMRFKNAPQVIGDDNIIAAGSEFGKYRSSYSYLVRIDQYAELGASDGMTSPKFFLVSIDREFNSGGPNQGEVSSQTFTIHEEVKLTSAKPSADKFLREPEAGKSSH